VIAGKEERVETLQTLEVDIENFSVFGRTTVSVAEFERLVEARAAEFEDNTAFTAQAKREKREDVLQQLEAITRVESAQVNVTAFQSV